MAVQNENSVSRREFMKTAAVGTAVLCGSRLPAFGAEYTVAGTKRKTPISTQMYALRDYPAKDGYSKLKQIADIGYKGVELTGFEGYKKASELRKVLDDLGLKANAKFVGLPGPDNLNETIDHAKTLGFSFVTVTFGPDVWKTTDDVKRNAEMVQRGAELLSPHGIQLLYHNHFWEFELIDGKLPYETFFELAPAVESLIDIYYVRNFGKVDAPPIVKKWSGRIPVMHIKDGPLVQGPNQAAVGAGKMDVVPCLKAADPKVLQWAVVDLESCDGDMMSALAQSYRYLTGTGLVEGNK